jgi:hypothetical protein
MRSKAANYRRTPKLGGALSIHDSPITIHDAFVVCRFRQENSYGPL